MTADGLPLETQPAQSPAQLAAALWADAAHQVYAVVRGQAVPDLPALLAEADVVDHDCLLPGALPPAVKAAAPYLVQLRAASPFTSWLLFEAPKALGPWGVLVLSRERQLSLRNHLRSLGKGLLPEGLVIDLDWPDARILQALLPLFDAPSLQRFFGPAQAFVLAEAEAFTRVEAVMGRARWLRTPLLGSTAA